VDVAGNAYVTGITSSSDFRRRRAFQTTFAGAFVTKLNPTGSGLVYSTYLGGSVERTATASPWILRQRLRDGPDLLDRLSDDAGGNPDNLQ